jgi:nucleotide-binding universal stress UspA family protein
MEPLMLATDGSPNAERATEQAIELAQVLDTDLVIVTIWDIPYGTVGLAPMPINGGFAQMHEDQAKRVAAEAAARAEEAGVEARTVVVRGFVVDEICGAARAFKPRYLIMGSHGWGAMKRALFGSVSTGVLHHAPCPVLVVRGEGAATAAVNGTRDAARATK